MAFQFSFNRIWVSCNGLHICFDNSCDSHKEQHSLEIWAVKLLFLLIYENMLKSIAAARSEYIAKQENKASYNTVYIIPDLIDFFGDDWEEPKTQTEKRNIHNCKKYWTD